MTGVFAATGFANNKSQQLRTEPLEVVSAKTTHEFVAEIAATYRERAKGLMFREEMPDNHGMLFIFETESDRYFWMKNTPLPLDILYIDAMGRIVSIAANTVPFSEKVIPSGAPARFVLELNAGTAKKLGISAGDQVSSESMSLE
ncbi:MAG: DUF192 domain-containing protein [Roseibium sp.]